MKNKIKNPLRKRVVRELLGDWRKYLVVFLFLVLTIGFVSGLFCGGRQSPAAAPNTGTPLPGALCAERPFVTSTYGAEHTGRSIDSMPNARGIQQERRNLYTRSGHSGAAGYTVS